MLKERPEKRMSRIKTTRYRLKNLDCGSCAAKIERELLKTVGVEEATVDFASLTLHLKATDIPKALAVITRIEPAVVVTLKTASGGELESHAPSTDSAYRKELVFIGIAAIILVVQIVFEERFHALAWPWVEHVIALSAYLLVGWNVLLGAARTLRRGQWFDENVLMVIATVGALAIHALAEAVGVMLFFKVGELLQNLAVSKSRRSVRAILAARPDRALVKSARAWVEKDPAQVNVGDIFLVKPGEKVALDGAVVAGNSLLDTSPLTGESVPLRVGPGAAVMAGTINSHAALEVRATKPFAASSIARVLELVENAATRKAATEKFITTFARYYTPAVVAIAAAIALVPPLVMHDALFSTWIYRALVLLVISCPCALVISIPLGYFGGIGRASHNGILIKGSMYIDALAKVTTVVFDKTGTLTRGVFTLDQLVPANGYSANDLLRYAAAAELHTTHPIGKSILEALHARGLELDASQVSDHGAIPGRGVSATYQGKKILVGNDSLLHEKGIDHTLCDFDRSVAHVIVDDQYAGHVLIGDQLKPDALQAMAQLRATGVNKLIMLTGDNECTAAGVANTLGLDAFHAGLLPEDKLRIFEELSADHPQDEKLAFVGDGINDAPVLARADVGIAMGGLGSEAAIETADVVLMTDAPLKIAKAVMIARDTRRIVMQNIVLALSVKGIFMLLGAIGMASMWAAVFADVGTALLALLNATRTLRDRA